MSAARAQSVSLKHIENGEEAMQQPMMNSQYGTDLQYQKRLTFAFLLPFFIVAKYLHAKDRADEMELVDFRAIGGSLKQQLSEKLGIDVDAIREHIASKNLAPLEHKIAATAPAEVVSALNSLLPFYNPIRAQIALQSISDEQFNELSFVAS